MNDTKSGRIRSAISITVSLATTMTYGAATPQTLTTGWDRCTYTNTGTHDDPIDIQDLSVDVLSIPNCWQQLQGLSGPGTAVSGVGDAAFGFSIGLAVEAGSRCLQIKGLTHAEFKDDYSHDVAMAQIVLGKLH